uniref:Uncharacterized protein n=1 Tax=Vombatus ursinus TaxID=29139 RepID=A0A4X2KSD7_VOMUR
MSSQQNQQLYHPLPKCQTSECLPKCPPQAPAPVSSEGCCRASSGGPYSPFSHWRRKSIRRRPQSSDCGDNGSGRSRKSRVCGECSGSC